MPGPMGGRRGPAAERAKDFKGTIKRLIAYIARDRVALVIAVACAMGSVAFNVIGPRVLGQATTELFQGLAAKVAGTGSIDFAKIGMILTALMCLYACAAGLNFIQGWLMTGITQRVCYRLRREIMAKVDRMPLSYFETTAVGDVLSRVTNDVDTLGQSLNQSVTQLITSVTQLVGVTVMMLSVSVALAGVTFLTIPVSLVCVYAAHHELRRESRLCGGRVRGRVPCGLRGHHRGRHPGVHAVRAQFHAAHHAAHAGFEHLAGTAAAHHDRARLYRRPSPVDSR